MSGVGALWSQCWPSSRNSIWEQSDFCSKDASQVQNVLWEVLLKAVKMFKGRKDQKPCCKRSDWMYVEADTALRLFHLYCLFRK